MRRALNPVSMDGGCNLSHISLKSPRSTWPKYVGLISKFRWDVLEEKICTFFCFTFDSIDFFVQPL